MYHVHVCGVCMYVCMYICMYVCLFVLKLLSFQSDGQADETARQADKQHRNPDNARHADRFSDGAKDVALEIRHGYDILQDIPDKISGLYKHMRRYNRSYVRMCVGHYMTFRTCAYVYVHTCLHSYMCACPPPAGRQTGRQTERRTDARTDGRADRREGRTDRQTNGPQPDVEP